MVKADMNAHWTSAAATTLPPYSKSLVAQASAMTVGVGVQDGVSGSTTQGGIFDYGDGTQPETCAATDAELE